MNQQSLIAALGLMSVVVALEGAWLSVRAQADKYLSRFNNRYLLIIIKLIYFLGFPFFALASGLIPARFFGLKGLEYMIIPTANEPATQIQAQLSNLFIAWQADFGPLISSGILLALSFMFFLWRYLTTLKHENNLQHIARIYPSKLGLLLDTIHWAFYRAIAWSLLGSLYLGVTGGLVFIIIEYVGMSKFGRFSNMRQQTYSLRFGIGITMAITFLFGPNLWFIIIIQFILVVGAEALIEFYQNSNIQRAYVTN